MEIKRDSKVLEDLDSVSKVLYEAKSVGLESEVSLWALYYMKEHPEASIKDAIQAGSNEWKL